MSCIVAVTLPTHFLLGAKPRAGVEIEFVAAIKCSASSYSLSTFRRWFSCFCFKNVYNNRSARKRYSSTSYYEHLYIIKAIINVELVSYQWPSIEDINHDLFLAESEWIFYAVGTNNKVIFEHTSSLVREPYIYVSQVFLCQWKVPGTLDFVKSFCHYGGWWFFLIIYVHSSRLMHGCIQFKLDNVLWYSI